MSDENRVNIPLLRKAVEWVEEQAEKPAIDREWNQTHWMARPADQARELAEEVGDVSYDRMQNALVAHCGTAHCVAGYVGQLLDARYATSVSVDDVHVSAFAADALGVDTTDCLEWEDPRDGRVVVPSLFAEDNSAADVRRIAEEIAGESL